MRNLTLEEKIVISKTLLISKIVFQSLITIFPRYIENELEKIKKAFLQKISSPEIKHETLCNYYKGVGLKNIDISNKANKVSNGRGSDDFTTICLISES